MSSSQEVGIEACCGLYDDVVRPCYDGAALVSRLNHLRFSLLAQVGMLHGTAQVQVNMQLGHNIGSEQQRRQQVLAHGTAHCPWLRTCFRRCLAVNAQLPCCPSHCRSDHVQIAD